MLEQAILEHASALNNLADAIRGIGQLPLNLSQVHAVTVSPTPAQAAEKPATKAKKEPVEAEAVGPFYWEDTSTNFFGKEDSIKALNKQLATRDTIKQISEERFNELKADLQARNEVAKEKMKSGTEKLAEAVSTIDAVNGVAAEIVKSEKASTPSSEESVVPSVEDVIACFTKYLPKDLDAEERKARHAVVKPLLAKLGADKATNLKPEHRAEAIAFIEGKLAELDDEVV